MKNLKSLIKLLGNLDLYLAVVSFVILTVITIIGVAMRYFFSNPFIWQEEVQQWMIVWIVLGAGSAAFRTGSHISVEIVVEMFNETVQKIIEGIICIFTSVVLTYFTIKGVEYVRQLIAYGRTTSVLKIPYEYIYFVLPLSCILMMLNNVYFMIGRLFMGKREAGDGI